MTKIRLFGIHGALRRGSTNRLLLAEARRLFGPADYDEAYLRLPLYDGDLEVEQGIPAEVQRLADQIAAADAVVIATPEYNKAPSSILKTRSTGSAGPRGGLSRTNRSPSSLPQRAGAAGTGRNSCSG